MASSSSSSHGALLGLALLLNRLTLGGILLNAGIDKLHKGVGEFYKAFEGMKPAWLPEWFAQPYGHAIPGAEVAVGILLILGFFGRLTALTATMMLLSFTIALRLKVGINGGGPMSFMNSNDVMVTLAFLLMVAGPGPLSADALWRGKGAKTTGA